MDNDAQSTGSVGANGTGDAGVLEKISDLNNEKKVVDCAFDGQSFNPNALSLKISEENDDLPPERNRDDNGSI